MPNDCELSWAYWLKCYCYRITDCCRMYVFLTVLNTRQKAKLRQIRKMRCRAFCFLFIILNVEVVHPIDKWHDSCMKFKWKRNFKFSFFDNYSLENDFNNSINNCLQRHSKVGTNSCGEAVISVKFPWISKDPNITLSKLHRPVLATKEASTNTACQILRAFEKIWKLFILCLMAAMLSGILIWFFVSIFRLI